VGDFGFLPESRKALSTLTKIGSPNTESEDKTLPYHKRRTENDISVRFSDERNFSMLFGSKTNKGFPAAQTFPSLIQHQECCTTLLFVRTDGGQFKASENAQHTPF
jgi:hypothetical protein